MTVILGIFFLLIIEKRTITRGSLKRSLLYTHLYGVFVFAINMIFDTNYMFIGRKSSVTSLIDYLGPWPYYIIPLDLILIGMFTLLYFAYFKWQRRGIIHE